MCPLTGEIVSLDDIDGMIDLYENLKEKSDAAYACLIALRVALAKKTEGDARTRRIRGKRRAAKIEIPADSWDQSLLKESWNSYPQYRDQVLKIDTIGVQIREFKKIVNTSGPADFEQFRNMVTQANRGPTGTPTVKVEM
jgi:hypothetical protein